jgi:hypothetical protein
MILHEVYLNPSADPNINQPSQQPQLVQYALTRQLNELLDTITYQTQPSVVVQNAYAVAAYPMIDPRVHHLDSYSLCDNTIVLHDGSLWKVNSWDMYKVLNWASNDVLSLSCTESFFGEKYILTNPVTGQSIHIDLLDGPVLFGPNSHWVVAIDHSLKRVYLENGSFWDVRFLDQNMLYQWAINDTVIVGDTNGWWSDSVLINVNMNQHVYAGRGY